MISCEHCEELINAKLDGLLTHQDALLLEDHLRQCEACRKLDQDLTSLHHRLQKLSFDPPEGLAASVLSQLEAPKPVKRRKAPWVAVACAAVVTLMVVTLSPQMLPFAGSGDTAATETAEAPETADMIGNAVPAEEAAQEESTAAEPAERAADLDAKTEPLTRDEAQDLLEEYLARQGLTLDVTPGTLSEDGAFWTFTGQDPDSGEGFQFSVSCSDGSVEKASLP